MLIDGKRIAEDIKHQLAAEVAQYKKKLSLGVFITQEDPVVLKFVTRKENFANEIGIAVTKYRLGPFKGTSDLLQKVLRAAREHDGIIVQLPLASHLEVEPLRQLLPITHDVDVFGMTSYAQFEEGSLPILPPVIGAISEILHRNSIHVGGKNTVVVGSGRLVGAPAAAWARRLGSNVNVIDRETPDISKFTKDADILILGAGSPGLIKPEHVKESAVVLDAGTSEVSGVLKGDADPSVGEKAALFTPTPGGIGPITVAMIFRNLLKLKTLRSHPGL